MFQGAVPDPFVDRDVVMHVVLVVLPQVDVTGART